MKFTIETFYKTMLKPRHRTPFMFSLNYMPSNLYDWTDYKKPTHLIQLKFDTLIDKVGESFDFCEDDFIELSVFTKFDLATNCNADLIKLLNLNSNSPTMKCFKFYLQKQCLAHVFSELYTVSNISAIEKALYGTKKQNAEIIEYFNKHQTTTFRVCCDMINPYNKGCFLVVNDDLNTLFPIISQRLDELLSLVVTENNQPLLNL